MDPFFCLCLNSTQIKFSKKKKKSSAVFNIQRPLLFLNKLQSPLFDPGLVNLPWFRAGRNFNNNKPKELLEYSWSLVTKVVFRPSLVLFATKFIPKKYRVLLSEQDPVNTCKISEKISNWFQEKKKRTIFGPTLHPPQPNQYAVLLSFSGYLTPSKKS